MSGITCEMQDDTNYHTFNDTWTLWAHLPHDTDWSLSSYKNILDINCVESVLTLENVIPDVMIQNCMIFCMRKNINPTWEDPNNRNGGSFSFKINNHVVSSVWKELLMNLTTETILNDELKNRQINGITVSPKKNFCILKIWMKDISIQDITLFNLPKEIDYKSTIFKKHVPED